MAWVFQQTGASHLLRIPDSAQIHFAMCTTGADGTPDTVWPPFRTVEAERAACFLTGVALGT